MQPLQSGASMRITWLERALDDFEEAVTYLAERNPKAAHTFAEHINASLLRLRAFPESGRPGRIPGTRELVIGQTHYIIPYRLKGQLIELLAVMHDAREWPEGFGG